MAIAEVFGQLPAFVRFCLVGSLVFVFGSLVLFIEIHQLHFSPWLAQFPMLILSMTLSWLLNRWLTFRNPSGLALFREWLGFMAVNGLGAAISAGVYTLVLFLTHKNGLMPYVALAMGTLVALGWNYLGSRHLIWSGKRS